MGFRQGLGHDAMVALPTTCPVLVREPVAFWSALKVAKWIERGSPTVSLSEITHSQLELAEFVQTEVEAGEKNYQDRKEKSAARLAQLASKMKG